MRRLISAVLVGMLAFSPVVLPQNAWAQSPDEKKQVEELSQKGVKAYKDGKFEKAIEYFEQAHAIQAVPNLLYNIARCYEKIGDDDKALEYYDKFIVDAVDRKAKQKALDKASAIREKQAKEKALADANKDSDKDNKDVKDPDKDKDKEVPPAEPDLTWAYVSLGTGGALLIGGAVFGLMASGKQTEFDDADNPEDKQSARDSGQTMALMADIFYIAGAAAVITGVILWATAEPEAQPAMTLRPTGWVGPDGAGVGLGTTF